MDGGRERGKDWIVVNVSIRWGRSLWSVSWLSTEDALDLARLDVVVVADVDAITIAEKEMDVATE